MQLKEKIITGRGIVSAGTVHCCYVRASLCTVYFINIIKCISNINLVKSDNKLSIFNLWLP